MDARRCRFMEREGRPSVVLVQTGSPDYYCIGSVVRCDDSGTYILTQSAISNPSLGDTIKTVFHDGEEKTATLVSTRDRLCIIRTERHARCKPIEFQQGPTVTSFVLLLAPSSRSSLYPIPSLLFQPSLASTLFRDKTKKVEGSDQMFTVSCAYGDKSPDQTCRLVGGPVFGKENKTIGIVVGDNNCRTNVADPDDEDSDYEDDGFAFKVCLSAVASRTKVLAMLEDAGVSVDHEPKQQLQTESRKNEEEKDGEGSEGAELKKRKIGP